MKNPINLYLHCFDCIKEKLSTISAQEWSRLEVGVTKQGELVVWCIRHDKQVANLGVSELTRHMATAQCAECEEGVQ